MTSTPAGPPGLRLALPVAVRSQVDECWDRRNDSLDHLRRHAAGRLAQWPARSGCPGSQPPDQAIWLVLIVTLVFIVTYDDWGLLPSTLALSAIVARHLRRTRCASGRRLAVRPADSG